MEVFVHTSLQRKDGRRILVGFIKLSLCKAETSRVKAERGRRSKANSCARTLHRSPKSLARCDKNGYK